jgi:ABC-2 type transport system ATP-binding protein
MAANLLVHKLSKSFRGTRRRICALDDVTFDVAPGDIAALLGPNGAGKSTSVKAIAGLVKPDAGYVSVCGYNPLQDATAQRRMGCLLEGARGLYWRLTPRENFDYLGTLKGMRRPEIKINGTLLLERFNIADKADERVQKLSRGTQQKVALAAVLLHRPRVILLDEPFVLLDTMTTSLLTDLLREAAADGVSVLVTTHQLEAAEAVAKSLIVMNAGRVIRRSQCDALLREFNKEGYMIRLGSPLTPTHSDQIVGLGLVRYDADEGILEIDGNATRLAAVLNVIPTNQVVMIEPRRVKLAQIVSALTQKPPVMLTA